MTRLFLAWIGIAILQLGVPRAISAAELVRPGGESTRVAPRLPTPSKQALEPHQSRREAVQTVGVTPFAPAASPRFSSAPAVGAPFTGACGSQGPSAAARVLPDARAPPA